MQLFVYWNQQILSLSVTLIIKKVNLELLAFTFLGSDFYEPLYYICIIYSYFIYLGDYASDWHSW